MTIVRDKHRAKCIEAMAIGMTGCASDESIEDAAAAFDALHGIARVVPIEATEEMMGYGEDGIREVWKEMSAAGDLTNPSPSSKYGDRALLDLQPQATVPIPDLTNPPEGKP
jgi:hypothetical protein